MSFFSRNNKALEFPEGAEWLNMDRPLTLEDLRGKIVLLDFWTFCCINCMHVIPDLKRLEEKYPELVVIGVHSAKFHNEQVRDNIRAAVLRYEIEHPVLVDNDFVLWRGYGIRAWPSFVLIDPVGNVAGRASGEGVYDIFDPVIASLIEAFDESDLLDREPMRYDLVKDRAPDGPLSFPGKIEADQRSRRLFVTDSNHNRVVVLDPDGEVLEIIGTGEIGRADGAFDEATFFRPQGLAYNPETNHLYVADTENHLLRMVDLSARRVRTILGTGHQGGHETEGRGTELALNSPWDVVILDDHLYIAMAGPHQLWRLDLRTHIAKRYAGSGREDIIDGPRTRAALAQPSGITTDGDAIYFADSEVSALRMVADDSVRTLVGKGLFEFGDVDGPLRRGRFQHPIGVEHDEGLLYVADTYNHKVKVVDPGEGVVRTLIGTGTAGRSDGMAAEAELNEPNDVALLDGLVYVADTNNHLIRVLDPSTGLVSTLELSNEEALYPSPWNALQAFRGKRVDLEPQEMAPSKGSLRIKLMPPEGHVWSADAPNFVEVLSTDDQVIAVPSFEPPDASFIYEVPLEAKAAGETDLVVRVVTYFCGEDAQGLCRFDATEYLLPVTVKEGASDRLRLERRITDA
jgi:DNA-binding beta-propeller fold protein YncE